MMWLISAYAELPTDLLILISDGLERRKLKLSLHTDVIL